MVGRRTENHRHKKRKSGRVSVCIPALPKHLCAVPLLGSVHRFKLIHRRKSALNARNRIPIIAAVSGPPRLEFRSV